VSGARYTDVTYIKVRGHWQYLYRAIDRAGNLVDVMLSQKRDMAAAIAFFRSAKAVTGVAPSRVTTDGHDSYPRAIRTTLGMNVRHRTSRYLNNRIEQDHRGIKSRYDPMRGFGATPSAARFCLCHDEHRNHLRLSRQRRTSSASARRRHFIRRSQSVLDVLIAA
jgi:transposase-like protein